MTLPYFALCAGFTVYRDALRRAGYIPTLRWAYSHNKTPGTDLPGVFCQLLLRYRSVQSLKCLHISASGGGQMSGRSRGMGSMNSTVFWLTA